MSDRAWVWLHGSYDNRTLRIHGFIPVTLIILLGIACTCQAEDKTNVEIEELINSLASQNVEKPQKVHLNDRGKRISAAIFPENFDFNQQTRVRGQLEKLARCDSNEVWPILLAHRGDNRYSLTVVDQNDEVSNWSVGRWCDEVVERDLYAAYQPHVPRIRGFERQGQFYVAWFPLVQKPTVLGPEWRQKNGQTPLWKLQVEFCKWAITEAPGLKQVSDQERDAFVDKIRAEIERLETTHEPAINTKKRTHEGLTTVSEKIAKRLLEKYEAALNKK